MKKLYALLFAFGMLLSVGLQAQNGQPTVTIPHVTAFPGQEVSIPIVVDFSVVDPLGVGAAEFVITFDPDVLEFMEVEQGVEEDQGGWDETLFTVNDNYGTVSGTIKLNASVNGEGTRLDGNLIYLKFNYLGGESTIVFDNKNVPGESEIGFAGYPAALSVSIDADPISFSEAGDVITYTFTVENTGDFPIGTVTVTNELTGLNEGIAELGTASNTYQEVFTATYTITADDVTAGVVTSTVTATGYDSVLEKNLSAEDELVINRQTGKKVLKNLAKDTGASNPITTTFTDGSISESTAPIPVSQWAFFLGFGLMALFLVIRVVRIL